MSREDRNESCCPSIDSGTCHFNIESVIGIDERGQIILPKELRGKLGKGWRNMLLYFN